MFYSKPEKSKVKTYIYSLKQISFANIENIEKMKTTESV